jgi:hypothetical protein
MRQGSQPSLRGRIVYDVTEINYRSILRCPLEKRRAIATQKSRRAHAGVH